MATSITVIKKDLISLQERGGVVASDMRRAHRNLHEHLCEIYFWWVEASQQGDYLEQEYQKLGRTFRTVSYGTNYAPLLWLVYGENNGLNNQYADRLSRALNELHNEVTQKSALYKKDGVAKLTNFIQQANGITALAGYALPKEVEVSGQLNLRGAACEEREKLELLNQAWMLDEFGIEEKQAIPYAPYVSTTPENYALLLVKRTNDGFELVDVDNDSQTVNSALADALRKRFDLCVFSIRPMLELVFTQCLPKSLEHLAERLVDVAELQDNKKVKKVKAHRRILYRADTNEFVLSPMNASSGVVSVVKPYFDIVLDGCATDVYMPYTERANVEKLLRDFEFNLYDTKLKTPPIPHYVELNSASHVVHLRHRTDPTQFQNLSFWPFYNTLKGPQNQLLVKKDYELNAIWHAHIDKDEIKRVQDEFIDKWLGGHARYLTREAHQTVRMTFADTWWAIEFVSEEGQFVNKQIVNLTPIAVSSSVVTAIFRTKDIVPALACLDGLPIIKVSSPQDNSDDAFKDAGLFPTKVDEGYRGSIYFDLDENLLRIKFYTDKLSGAEHVIYVPTLNEQGILSEVPFYQYQPQITIDTAESVQEDDAFPEQVEIE